MARKTIADLEAELLDEKNKSKALQEELDTAPALTESPDTEILKQELANTKAELVKAKAHTSESEARTLSAITAMGEESHEIVDGMMGACMVFTPDEYKEYSASKGMIMGRRPNQKTKCSIEELRALINSDWTPSMVMEKHGLTPNDIQQLIWKLSAAELRDNAIKFSIERDFFGKEG